MKKFAFTVKLYWSEGKYFKREIHYLPGTNLAHLRERQYYAHKYLFNIKHSSGILLVKSPTHYKILILNIETTMQRMYFGIAY